MNSELASVIALKLLAFLASDEDRVNALQMETGLSLGDLRESAADPALHAGLLDYVLQNESLLLEFAATVQQQPESIVRARQHLPGFSHDA